MVIRTKIIDQRVSYKPVAYELQEWLHVLQDRCHYKVIDVIKTKVNNPDNKQGFIILYNDMENEVY